MVHICFVNFVIGASDAPVSSGTAKPNETPITQRSSRAVPKAPTSQSATLISDTASPMTPAKGNFCAWYMYR